MDGDVGRMTLSPMDVDVDVDVDTARPLRSSPRVIFYSILATRIEAPWPTFSNSDADLNFYFILWKVRTVSKRLDYDKGLARSNAKTREHRYTTGYSTVINESCS